MDEHQGVSKPALDTTFLTETVFEHELFTRLIL